MTFVKMFTWTGSEVQLKVDLNRERKGRVVKMVVKLPYWLDAYSLNTNVEQLSQRLAGDVLNNYLFQNSKP